MLTVVATLAYHLLVTIKEHLLLFLRSSLVILQKGQGNMCESTLDRLKLVMSVFFSVFSQEVK